MSNFRKIAITITLLALLVAFAIWYRKKNHSGKDTTPPVDDTPVQEASNTMLAPKEHFMPPKELEKPVLSEQEILEHISLGVIPKVEAITKPLQDKITAIESRISNVDSGKMAKQGKAAPGAYIDLQSINGGGGSWFGFLAVSNVVSANANIRTTTMYTIAGRGNSAEIAQISADTKQGGAPFKISTPANGVIRVTNGSVHQTDVSIAFFGTTGA